MRGHPVVMDNEVEQPASQPIANRIVGEFIESDTRLDPAVSVLASPAGALANGRIGSLLRGEWLGHPLHPMLTDLPIGFWTSSSILDFIGGRKARPASQRLIALGLISLVPTAAAGAVDWSSIDDQKKRRVGAVHAISNTVAAIVYFLSWRSRRRGNHATGVALGVIAAGLASVGGFLGGHLAFAGGEDDRGRSE
jgi:uncharacterized membrane protein